MLVKDQRGGGGGGGTKDVQDKGQLHLDNYENKNQETRKQTQDQGKKW